jgi:hypothetical protein
MLIFKKKSIMVKASSADIANVFKKLAWFKFLPHSITEYSFSFVMRIPWIQDLSYTSIRFIGCIEEHGCESTITYHMVPGVFSLLFLSFVLCFLIAAIVSSLCSNTTFIFPIAAAGFFSYYLFLVFEEEEKCEKQFIRKLRELEERKLY